MIALERGNYEVGARAKWMSVLASASRAEIEDTWEHLEDKPPFQWVTAPEFGTVMARARASRTGNVFNLSDVSVTRCSLKIDTGQIGVAYIAGRDKRHAALAAIIDACLQHPAKRARLKETVDALGQAIEDRRRAKVVRAYSTRADFSQTVDNV